ncbi:TPA: hypothetical protein I8Z27_001911 [Legionella pneumophila]|nr:hypothetical protein [Legionella pneumophila]HAT1827488.1 hypothetical protein [Legionella pneumophila]HAT2093869.1 hypothetical protein [Legionella pneumophila]
MVGFLDEGLLGYFSTRYCKIIKKVSVVGFLDEGLLVCCIIRNNIAICVSVVGFLDEGLLGMDLIDIRKLCVVSVVGFLDEGLLVKYGNGNIFYYRFQWLDF